MNIRFCVAAALLLMPAAALAQGNPGPYGGLFGRAPARAGQDRTVVAVRSSVAGQYDSAILPPTPDIEVGQGTGLGATAGLSVQHETDKFTAVANGAATRAQYFQTPAYAASMYSGNAHITSAISSRITADAGAAYSHSPFYAFYPSLGRESVVDSEAPVGSAVPFSPYANQMMENESVYGSAGVTARLTERMRLLASAYRRQTMFSTSDADFKENGYVARWTWQLARSLGVHAGYGMSHSDQAGDLGHDYDNETIDIGVDYSRAFSIARRTTLGFSTATALLKTGNSPREVRVNGEVTLAKHFRRTWRAATYARRGTSFVPGFYEPLYSDSVGVSIGGMFSTRLEWIASAEASRGEAAFSNTTGYDTVTASSKLSFAISKHLGLYGQYTVYQYEVPVNSNALGLSQRLARQTVSVGLTAYIPVYQKMGQ